MPTQFADVEAGLVAWLQARFAGDRAVTELPADLSTGRVVRVMRISGGDRDLVIDDAIVDVDCYAATRAESRSFAEQVRAAIVYDLPGTVIPGGVVARVNTGVGPRWIPWDDLNVRRFGATYQITVHSTP